MKKPAILFFALINIYLYALGDTEKEIKSKVDEVTVYISGAQITRNEQVNLPAGTTTLKFTGLSPYIDSKSIKIKSSGLVTVLSVNHQLNYIDPVKKSTEIEGYIKQIKELEDKIELENTYLAMLKDETEFLNLNKKNKQQRKRTYPC